MRADCVAEHRIRGDTPFGGECHGWTKRLQRDTGDKGRDLEHPANHRLTDVSNDRPEREDRGGLVYYAEVPAPTLRVPAIHRGREPRGECSAAATQPQTIRVTAHIPVEHVSLVPERQTA